VRRGSSTAGRVTVVAVVLVVLLVASITLAITVGPTNITPTEVWGSVAHHLGLGASPLPELRDGIVWQLRLPRVLTAAAVGVVFYLRRRRGQAA